MVSELTTYWSPRPSTCWRHDCARRCRSSNILHSRSKPGSRASEKPITEAIADSVLSKQIDGVEATLNRNGYTARVLTEMLGVKAGELRGLFKNELGAERTRDLKEQMLSAGLPV